MPSKIMMIRHAEKPTDSPPPHGVTMRGTHDTEALSVRGWQRAGALALLLAPLQGQFQNLQLAAPDHIYAMDIEKGSESSRPQQTVTPLLEKLGSRGHSNFTFPKGREKEMIASVLEQAGVVLVCWEHKRLAHAARNIPLSENNTMPVPDKWDKQRYDLVWIFDRDPNGDGYIFSTAPQLALAGDKA